MKLLKLMVWFIIIFQLGCMHQNNSDFDREAVERLNEFNHSSSVKEYVQLVKCTANFWVHNTRLYKYSNYRHDYYEFDVPMIYFNEDSTKFIAILTSKSYKDTLTFQNYANPNDSFTYNYQMIIFVHDDRPLIYPFKIRVGFGEISWKEAAVTAMKFLENDLANRSIFANNRPSKEVKLNYNVLDKDFWEKSPLFQKGLQVEGYYYFQNYDNSSNENPTVISLPPSPCFNDFNPKQ